MLRALATSEAVSSRSRSSASVPRRAGWRRSRSCSRRCRWTPAWGFVLVQHLDPEHEIALTQILSRATALPVCDVTNNQPVQPNCVYIIPPDTNLSIAKGLLKLQPRPKTRTPHRPIDSFFESLAADHGERAIGVVLSGTASDGTLGLEAIKAEGGITFAQDDSAKYDSMPRSAVAAGCVDLVLSPKEIAEELARIAKHPYVARGEWRVASREW